MDEIIHGGINPSNCWKQPTATTIRNQLSEEIDSFLVGISQSSLLTEFELVSNWKHLVNPGYIFKSRQKGLDN